MLGKAFGCLSQLLVEQQRGQSSRVSEGFTDCSHKQPKSHHKPSPALDPARPLGTSKSHLQGSSHGGRLQTGGEQNQISSCTCTGTAMALPLPTRRALWRECTRRGKIAEKGGEFIQQTGASVHCCLAAWHLCDS